MNDRSGALGTCLLSSAAMTGCMIKLPSGVFSAYGLGTCFMSMRPLMPRLRQRRMARAGDRQPDVSILSSYMYWLSMILTEVLPGFLEPRHRELKPNRA